MKGEYTLNQVFVLDLRLFAGLTLLATFIIGFVGNLIVLSAIIIILRQRKNIPNILILLLTITDIFLVTITYTQPLMTYVSGIFIGGNLACNIHASLLLFFNTLSLLIIVAMVSDRYLAVSRPYCYQNKMSYSKTKAIIFMTSCILISTMVSLPSVIGFSSNTLYYPGTYCMFTLNDMNDRDQLMLIFYTLILSVMMLLVILGNTAGSFSVHKMLEFRQKHSRSDTNLKKTEEYLFLRLSIVTMATFIIVWLPLYIAICLSLSRINYPKWYGMISIRFAALHGVINPWLHPILRRKFRKAFVWVFYKSISCLTCGYVTTPSYDLDFSCEIVPKKADLHQANSFTRILNEAITLTESDVEIRLKRDNILNDDNHNIQQVKDNIMELQDFNEMSENVMFDMAQINMMDYVDGPDDYGDGPDTFRSYSGPKTPPLISDLEMQHVSSGVVTSILAMDIVVPNTEQAQEVSE